MSGMKPIFDNQHELAANRFIQNKRRMPQDFMELREWLMEFSDYSGKLADEWHRLYQNHLNSCPTRYFLIGEKLSTLTPPEDPGLRMEANGCIQDKKGTVTP
jgi:hypothetical protein